MHTAAMKQVKPQLLIVIFTAFMLCPVLAYSQGADQSENSSKPSTDQPSSLKEMMAKMRIDQEKKEYDEMIDRGQQAAKISTELERSFQQNPTVSRLDRERLDDLERLVKKIRNELGAEGGIDDPDNDDGDVAESPKSTVDGVKTLQNLTNKLVDELKKNTRFGVSAIAIQSTNSVLRVVRFLKISNSK
jgi:hypothetical protein